MVSTASPNLRLEIPAPGDYRGNWDLIMARLIDQIDDSIAGTTVVATTGGSSTLTEVDYLESAARHAAVTVTGALTSNATIVVPARSKSYVFLNQTTGAFALSIKTPAGATLLGPPQGSAGVIRVAATGECTIAAPYVNVATGAVTGVNYALNTALDAEIARAVAAEGLLVKKDGSTPFTGTQSGVTPTAAAHLTRKDYVDAADVADRAAATAALAAEVALLVRKDGTTAFTGVQSGVTPTAAAHLTRKDYVDAGDATVAANAATALATEVGLLVKKDGSTPFTGTQSGVTPTAAAHLTRKDYVDAADVADRAAAAAALAADVALLVRKDGTTPFTGVQSGVTPTAAAHLTRKDYVDSATGLLVRKDGTTPFTAVQTGVTPTADLHLSTKKYVDDQIALVTGGTGVSASVISSTPSGNLSSTNVQAALNELDAEKALLVHGHTGSEISNVPAGNIAATTVQAALNELDSEKSAVGHVHEASAITNTAAGNIASTNVQAALNELDSEKLASTSYTAADVLAKLLTVDGAGSGLDADLLDGLSSGSFQAALGYTPLNKAGDTISGNLNFGSSRIEPGTGDIYLRRAAAPTTGVVFFGDGSKFLFFNGTNYVFQGADITIADRLIGRGTAKAWANFSMGSGGINTNETFNISSIVRNAVARFTLNFQAAFANTNYVAAGMARGNGGRLALSLHNTSNTKTTSAMQFVVIVRDTTAIDTDPSEVSVVLFGS